MNKNFNRLLGDATRLTRSGDLGAATRTIRQALDGAGGPSTAAARSSAHVPPPPSAAARSYADASVLEGEWFHRGATAPAEPRAKSDATWDTTANRSSESSGRANPEGEISRGCHPGRAGALDYRLFVPPLDPGAPPPALVVMLHGCTQNADDFAVGTRMDTLALEHGFLALYPEQSGRANPQRCWNWFKHVHQRRGRGEPGMIEETVRTILDTHGADPTRVFVAGLSAGGAMASILGNACSGLFAGVGVHSGLAAGAAQDLPGALAAMQGGPGVPVRSSPPGPATRQPPTIVFHGDADRTVHPDNAERVVELCLDGARNSAPTPAAERETGQRAGRRWSREVHRDTHGKAVVERWLVHGAGHAWSGGDGRGSYADAIGPDASAEMVRFFLAQGAR